MRYSTFKFHTLLFFTALLGTLFLVSMNVSDAKAANSELIIEQNQSEPTVIFNGVRYPYTEFKQDIVKEHERIIYLDSRWMGDNSNIWYAFTNPGDMATFAATMGVNATVDTSAEGEPDILPVELELDQLRQSSLVDNAYRNPCSTGGDYRFYDLEYCDGSNGVLNTNVDLSNLHTTGSGWGDRIGSLYNGGKALILFVDTNYSCEGYVMPAYGTTTIFYNPWLNAFSSMDFYPYH